MDNIIVNALWFGILNISYYLLALESQTAALVSFDFCLIFVVSTHTSPV